MFTQHAKIGREPSMAEVFRRTHAVEHTDEERNVTYEWADSKSAGVMVNMLIRMN